MNPFYFHIGLPKTGTTYLQNIIAKDERINFSRSNIHKFHKNDSLIYVNDKVNVDSNETYLLRGQGAKKYNMMLTLSKIKQKYQGAKIVVTLREPLSALQSMFKYRIKNGKHFKDFDEWFFADEAQDFFSLLHYNTLHISLRAFFKAEDIYYIFYEDLKTGKMIRDFYQIINMKPPIFDPKNMVNKNLSNSEVLKINILNQYLPNKKIRNRLKDYLPKDLLNEKTSFFESNYKSKIIFELQKEMKDFYTICDAKTKFGLLDHLYLV